MTVMDDGEDQEPLIERADIDAILSALLDITGHLAVIRRILEEDDDGEEEEDDLS